MLTWPCVSYDLSYLRSGEEGPHRKDHNQLHRHSTGWSSLTSQREREVPESQHNAEEISEMGRVDVIQALRASLAGKWVSDEDYSIMTLEPTLLGFWKHLEEGEMTQLFWRLPGHSQHFLPPKYCLVSVATCAYSSISYDLFSRVGPGSRKSQKQEAQPPNPGLKARKECGP